MRKIFEIPEELKPWQGKILSTAVDFVRIKTVSRPVKNLWESRIGGHPYWPAEMDYPTDASGAHLYFLAQLNMGDIPPLPGFPESGMLQFFVFDDATFGEDIENPANQDRFRVVYHPVLNLNKEDLVDDFSFLRLFEETILPEDRCFPLEFSLEEELVPLSDKHFQHTFGEYFLRQFGDQEWEIREKYNQHINSEGHKMGGYVYFAQEDYRAADDDAVLLLQLDSEVERELCWGDMGVAHFFISKSALLKRDFSGVKFTWDCL